VPETDGGRKVEMPRSSEDQVQMRCGRLVASTVALARTVTKAPLRTCTPVAPIARAPCLPPSVSSEVTATRSNTRTPRRRSSSRSSGLKLCPQTRRTKRLV